MEKRDILLQLIQHYTSGSKTQFAKMIGLTPQALGNMIARNKLDVERLLTNCVNINPTFLLTGEYPITLEGGDSVPSPSEPDKKNEKLINELLTVCNVLTEERNALRKDMEDVKAILRKSQEQFDRVLSLVERVSTPYHHPSDARYMVAEDEPQK